MYALNDDEIMDAFWARLTQFDDPARNPCPRGDCGQPHDAQLTCDEATDLMIADANMGSPPY